MYGSDINTLNLYVKRGNYFGSPRWSEHGSQGNRWLHGNVEVNAQNGDLVSAIYMTIQNRLKLTAWIRKIDKGIIKKSQ